MLLLLLSNDLVALSLATDYASVGSRPKTWPVLASTDLPRRSLQLLAASNRAHTRS